MMVELIILLGLWLYVLLQLLILAGYLSDHPIGPKLMAEPKVAILIPARNEEEHIRKCLKSVLALHYPVDKLEIWVGNDGSTDQTAQIVKTFAEANSHLHLYDVQGVLGSAKAKSNVLAQLVHQCRADYIFVCDADIEVGPNWIRSLLPHLLEENMGIVSGTTLVDGKSYFEKFQGLDWTLGNGYLIGLERLGLKSTAVGNNMAFTRIAYLQTGGYETMPFSVTEDFQLFQAIRQKGYQTRNLLEARSLNISAAQSSLKQMLHQRKRWMIGAQKLPWYWLIIFGLQALFYPLLFLLLILHTKLALQIWFIKILLQMLYSILLLSRLKQRINWLCIILFEAYTLPVQLMMIAFYLAPVKMNWKQREYA